MYSSTFILHSTGKAKVSGRQSPLYCSHLRVWKVKCTVCLAIFIAICSLCPYVLTRLDSTFMCLSTCSMFLFDSIPLLFLGIS